MSKATIIKTILGDITQTINGLPEGHILCSGGAFKIAEQIADAFVSSEDPNLTDVEKRRAIMDILHEAYPAAREIVARQMIGITFEQMVDTLTRARERFHGTRELAITPKPTLAYTGECEPLDPWNLYSNAVHADIAAKKALEIGALSDTDEDLLNEIERTKQVLHFIIQREIKVEDITGQPFDGKITHQTRPAPLS
jgi:hypothetical protein